MKLSDEAIKAKAISIIKEEVSKYDDPLFFVTEKVAFAMRELIRKLRKNYWGVFEDEKKDKQTGKDNIWVPLTRLIVDTVRKNADMDSKDAVVFAKKRSAQMTAKIVRNFIRMWQDKTFFGEAINDTILDLCIDGTVVWKTVKVRRNGKWQIDRRTVDLLNVYIDPNADNIQSAFRFTERSLMTPDEIEGMNWMDNQNIKGQSNLSPLERNLTNSISVGKYVDVYEMWGKIPESLITGKVYKNKGDNLVDGRIVVSGIDSGNLRVHVIEKNTNKDKAGNIIKPYEECRFIKVSNRWYGVGPAEMVLQMQEWVNRVVNLRIKKNTNASLGLFKIRNGSGVTQQQLTNLTTSGVIKLNDMNDMENLPIPEAGAGSYQDEEIAKKWAFEVTSTYDTARGAPGPASASATATVIEDRNQKSAFIIIKEAIGLFQERWMSRHFMPHLPALIKQEDVIKIFSDFEEIEALRTSLVNAYALEQMEKQYEKTGQVPTVEELTQAMNIADEKMRADGDLFMETLTDLIVDDYDVKVVFSNETVDVALTVQNLTTMANMLPPGAQMKVVAQALDLMGLDVPSELRTMPKQMEQQMQQGQAAPIQGLPPTEQSLVTNANATV